MRVFRDQWHSDERIREFLTEDWLQLEQRHKTTQNMTCKTQRAVNYESEKEGGIPNKISLI